MANTRETLGEQATLDGLINNTLTSLEESGVNKLGTRALYHKTALTSINFPNVKTLETYSLNGCTGLTSIELPSVTSISSYALGACTNLTTVDLSGSNACSISANAFNGDTKLKHLIIRSTSMSTLSATSAFTSTPIAREDGAIYVPSDLLNNYKANSTWKNYFITTIDKYPLTSFETITDTWAEIFAAEDNDTYKTKYSVGDTKSIDLGSLGTYRMQIAAFDTDTLADESGTAKITWIMKECMATHNMNSTNTTSGGWESSAMRTYLTGTVKPAIPEVIRNRILTVTKVQSIYDSAVVKDGQTTQDDVWIPSDHEVGFGTTYETTGPVYSGIFTVGTNSSANSTRIKYLNGSADSWWLRSAGSASGFRSVGSNGSTSNFNASNANGVVLGFCT